MDEAFEASLKEQESVIRRVAHIMGPLSAAAKALQELESRRQEGHDDVVFMLGDRIIVGPREGLASQA